MTADDRWWNCCPCCDQGDDYHLTRGKHYHDEPCDEHQNV